MPASTVLPILLWAGFFSGTALAQEPAEPADCASARTNQDMLTVIDEAEQAFAELEVEAFNDATTRMHAWVPCVEEELLRPVAARVLRYDGMAAFVAQDPERAERSFAAARLVEPNYRFPTWLVPDGNPLQTTYQALDPASTATETLAAPRSGRIQLNGTLTLTHHSELPALVQLFDDDGAVLTTTLLQPGDPLPDYEPLPPGMSSPVAYDAMRMSPRKLRRLGGAGLFAASGVTTYALALSTRARYDDPGNLNDLSELDRLNRRANALGATGLGLGAVAAAFGASAVMVSF